jgi:urea transport system substrate-binding protein
MLIGIVLLLLIFLSLFLQYVKRTDLSPIRIGILHSLSGTMAGSEKPLVDTLLMGVDEINASGGLLGRQVEAIVVDGRSDWGHFASEAERLIRDEKVAVIFGCWTSACRKAVKPVVEKYNHLLFYPVQYEGLEQSANIIYTGAAPNQQIILGVSWSLKEFGRRIYLLGSDYVFPRTANFIIRDIVKAKKATIVAERYIPLDSTDFNEIIAEIKELQPDVIFNTINGDSNQHFFAKKYQADLDEIPVISFSIGEAELASIAEARIKTHYAVWNYFQSIDNPVNYGFISKIKQRLGAQQVVGDPMEASYIGLRLWFQAVTLAESIDPALIHNAINEQTFNAPQGIVSIDSVNHHLRKFVRVGQARSDGQFDIVWQSEYAIRPVPFPTYRSRRQWQEIIEEIAKSGNN